jgi:dTDP-L-rhamnose 4-epimerase
MAGLVLVTGGAGFIGRHVVRALLERGDAVRVVDSLIDQVHHASLPDPILDEVDFIHGDVRDQALMTRAVRGVDKVVHLAAEVGVGQSMYAIDRYVSVNDHGSAVLFQALSGHPVERVVVASSMSIYGEGLYRGGEPGERTRAQLERREWDFPGLEPMPTPETKTPALSSIYALTKYDQERACLVAGAAYGIPTVALRLFNVYGPGQALSNPYTGVLAIFAARLLNDRAPRIFEDGEQRRDFVSVHDVARAFALALERDGADGLAVNIGSGESVTVNALATSLARTLGKDIAPEVTGEFRVGDIRHCFADIALARETLGYEAQVALDDGIAELAGWLAGQKAVDRVDEAAAELARRGLTG